VSTLYRPELLYAAGAFHRDAGVMVDANGRVMRAGGEQATASFDTVSLPGKALLPGFVNTHSHAFQRLIRGQSESRVRSGRNFWSWRNTMYHAAANLDPDDMYDVARMAFLEMLLSGATTVGEFHYVHNQPGGQPYEDPNLLSKQVIAAAQSTGIRIVLLRSAYQRSGFELPADPGQVRFFETGDQFLRNMESLSKAYPATTEGVQLGVAPHSLRAVPLGDLKQISAWTRAQGLPLHMHVAEQVAENEACLREYGASPVALLHKEKLLGADFTAIHAIHITPEEVDQLAQANATICSCPTTERNLGDGIIAADLAMSKGIRVALGSDSQAQIDPLEDARQLEYHLRLERQERAVLDQVGGEPLPERLLACATNHGANALRVPNDAADFFTIDLDDPSIAGHSEHDLLPLTVFSLNRTAICDVMVNGRWVVRNHRHPLQEEIIARYQQMHRKVWSSGT
jgi:formimidoylglutamate deiminase